MSLNAVKMLGISITISHKKEILEEVRKYLSHHQTSTIKHQPSGIKPYGIVTPNPEQIVLAQKDKEFARILNQADIKLPDGVGLVAAMRLVTCSGVRTRGSELTARIAGVELMEDLAAMAAERGYPIALIGGRGGVAVEALECLRKRHPKLVGWAEEPGDYNKYNDYNFYNCYKKIQKTGVRFVFVGLGAPKQEYFLEKLKTQNSKLKTPLVLMAVGGSFDMIAGRIKRAPLLARNLGLEWLWRLMQEPWRLRRQLALVRFIWLVLRQKLSV